MNYEKNNIINIKINIKYINIYKTYKYIKYIKYIIYVNLLNIY